MAEKIINGFSVVAYATQPEARARARVSGDAAPAR